MTGSAVLLSRLRRLTALGADEVDAIGALMSAHSVVAGERPIVFEGDEPRRLHILIDGMAARAKMLRDGQRHLSALLIPGDICDVDGLHVRAYDYGVVALTRCALATIDRGAMVALCAARPAVARALAFLGHVDNSMLNEAATSMARRTALERVAFMICELQMRLAAIGQSRVKQAGADRFHLPLSQAQLADALGITSVHLNRVLGQMRREGLVTLAGRTVTIPDPSALRRVAGFAPSYLHLDGMRVAA